MSGGGVARCSVVCGTLVGGSAVFSIMCSGSRVADYVGYQLTSMVVSL